MGESMGISEDFPVGLDSQVATRGHKNLGMYAPLCAALRDIQYKLAVGLLHKRSCRVSARPARENAMGPKKKAWEKVVRRKPHIKSARCPGPAPKPW